MLEDAGSRLLAFAEEHVPADRLGSCFVGHGSIHGEILRMSEQIKADLIVMASHKPAVRDYLLGPNAAHVMRHASVSVLIIRN
ncbi:MAG: hypothetical protein CMM46_11275 [Rhodospirillaceae bacterium]|mgnify:CR=1 FL=1|nr:hypothetical protein [Rhodospirillaceae bacterium]|tara:strand:+ start:1698 stop:1946 length:249 start_codon:yes stop_codon:yes gene_type:complete